ncbi:hypothetical protein CVU37_10625 [candidate division BRC1 bacterium HGW-BRC1-1]|jgi:hypothetical protein|nr:MAG: hypothetical protein CVU37_10625 [candidate division BRC1 bacterium HGW-BRC1-1]
MTISKTILGYTLALRRTVSEVVQTIPEKHWETIPSGWSNNARWHVGHLIITPQRLTYGQLKQPVAVSQEYQKWFARGSSPAAWADDVLPEMVHLLDEMITSTEALFESMTSRWDDPYSQPMVTSSGAILHTPGEALTFNTAHDGIHLGCLYGLRHALSAEAPQSNQDRRKSAMR